MAEQGKRSGIVQVRAQRSDAWTKATRVDFLSRLATTCNVSRSCLAVGRSVGGLYRLRDREPAFAAAWDAALEQGYGRIEAELMRCALGNSGDADADAELGPDLPSEPAKPFDPELALKLLAQRQAKDAKGQRKRVYMRQPTRLEVMAELDKRLTAMERRIGRAAQNVAETKA